MQSRGGAISVDTALDTAVHPGVHKWGEQRSVDLRNFFVLRTEHFCISSFEERHLSKLMTFAI